MNDQLMDRCHFCGIEARSSELPLLTCSGCASVVYCGKEHQKFDWKKHKVTCKTIGGQKRRNKSINNSKEESIAENKATVHDHPTLGVSEEKLLSEGNVQATTAGDKIQSPTRLQKSSRRTSSSTHFKDHTQNRLFTTSLHDHMRMLATKRMAVNQHQAISLRLKCIAEHAVNSLNEYGWAIIDNFLGPTHCQNTFQEVEKLYKLGLFSAGELMEKKNDFSSASIRSDQIYWFNCEDEGTSDAVTLRLLISIVDSLIGHFAGRIPPYFINGRSKAMIACYPGNGTRYVKHVDNPVEDGRCVTAIYYCNRDWDLAKDGGILRLYPETSDIAIDIDPIADRLVFFWSDRRNPHEVLPVHRHRYAITIWYFDQEEKLAAMQRVRRLAENRETGSNSNSANTNQSKLIQEEEGTSRIDSAIARTPSENLAQWKSLGEVSRMSGKNEKSGVLFASLPDINRVCREMRHFKRLL